MTNETRKLIKAELLKLSEVKEIYYKDAETDAMYPHIVFDVEERALSDDLNRRDYTLYVDLYFKEIKPLEDTADAIIKGLDGANLPQAKVLPTFYYNGSWNVNEKKGEFHKQIRFDIQNYERRP